jgi:hypothetical protein
LFRAWDCRLEGREWDAWAVFEELGFHARVGMLEVMRWRRGSRMVVY